MQLDQQVFALTVRCETEDHARSAGLDDAINMQDILDVHRPATDEIIVAQTTGDDNDLVFDEKVAKLLKRLAEKAHFHSRRIIIEDDAYTIAALSYIHNQTGNSRLTLGLCLFTFTLAGLRCRF